MVKLRQVPLDAHFVSEKVRPPVPAPKIKRLVNLLLDYFGAIILLTLIFFLLILVGAENWIPHQYSSSELTRQAIGVCAIFFYYVFMEYFFKGKTLGKYFTQTKVIMLNGASPSFKAILWRALTRFIPFEPFSLLFKKSQAWHDSFSGTMVVEDW